MDKDIDTSRRKPRQTRGTPAYWAANRLGFGILAFGVLFGALFMFMPGTRNANNKLQQILKDSEEDVKAKKYFMKRSMARQMRAEEIQEIMDELETD